MDDSPGYHTHRRRAGDLAANPELWTALDDGKLLRTILEDFYTEVLAHPRLGPFFEGVTKERIVSKQYSFLMELFTGVKVYFGDRPRNAHHWMVITDEMFDLRESLLEAAALRHGLSEAHWAQWRKVDEVFRKQIVKPEPIPKKLRGLSLPCEGFDEVVLQFGSMCDGCDRAVEVGERVRYHVRTGKSYCTTCAPAVEAAARQAGARKAP